MKILLVQSDGVSTCNACTIVQMVGSIFMIAVPVQTDDGIYMINRLSSVTVDFFQSVSYDFW